MDRVEDSLESLELMGIATYLLQGPSALRPNAVTQLCRSMLPWSQRREIHHKALLGRCTEK